MRAVNLLTPELRSAQKGSGAPRPPSWRPPVASARSRSSVRSPCASSPSRATCSPATSIKEREATLAAVSAKNDETVKRAAELKPYADFQTLANERASTVQALAERALRLGADAARPVARPPLQRLPQLARTATSGAEHRRRLRRPLGSISAPAISLAGCTRSQPAVAALMSRLRNIQGVTRVSLSKSEKADAAGQRRSDRPVRQGLAAELRARRLLREGDRRRRPGRRDQGPPAAPAAATPAAKTGDAAATPTPAATKEGATP